MKKNKFTQYLSTNPDLQRIIDRKLQHKKGNYTLEKSRKYTNIIRHLKTKIMGSNNYFSLVSLNINGFIHKEDPAFCCIQEMYLSDKDRHYLRIKGCNTIFHVNGTPKTSWNSHYNIK